MSGLYNLLIQLTSASSDLTDSDKRRALNDFSDHFGWTPNDKLEVPTIEAISNANLVVEHGFENQAVISFLKKPHHELSFQEQRDLLSISYNNLVDWHIQIQSDQITYVFNRHFPFQIAKKDYLSKDNLDVLKSETFENITSQKQSPNLPCLDDALLETISHWKKILSLELSSSNITNRHLSALFNAIIFVRAVEDNYKNSLSHRSENGAMYKPIFMTAAESMSVGSTVGQIVQQALHLLEQGNVSQKLIDFSALSIFDSLDSQLVIDIVRDFYRIRHAKPYEYDFSLMSKHALSRIYERYTSILKQVESDQLSFFPVLPEESFDKSLGNVYTPQFIARFFSRYLREQVSRSLFRKIRTLEPSVGSGIFLRTLLESQCDLMQEGVTTDLIKQAFNNVVGLDIDPNACHASTLSLSLLHLVLTNQLPIELNIINSNTISYYQDNLGMQSSFDAVIANPPFISWGEQTDEMRKQISGFLGRHGKGRLDYYLAFLKIALASLKPGGYALFVVPHTFLVGDSSTGLRKLIAEEAWIRCIVDLSGVKVFSEVATYVVLLIFQKKYNLTPPPSALIVQCRALVSEAFDAVLENREVNTRLYTTFKLSQNSFTSDTWLLLPPSVLSIHQKLNSLPKISDFMDVRVGVQTGSNKVFIFNEKDIPKNEMSVFTPYLPDKEMLPYVVPKKTSQYLFYPYLDGKKLSSTFLEENFPKTWNRLVKSQDILSERTAVKRKQIEWWQLERPRLDYIMLPKILVPHLVIRPRFTLDLDGQYTVIRSPVIVPKQSNENSQELDIETLDNDLLRDESFDEMALGDNEEISKELLKYFAAILNSTVCYRYISENADRYGNGYTMLEPKRLQNTPVPNPKTVDPKTLSRLISLVDIRLGAVGEQIIQVEEEIDNIVSGLYGLTSEEIMNYQVNRNS